MAFSEPQTPEGLFRFYYQISLHVDDEAIIASYGKEYGFDVFQLDAEDDEWKEKILERFKKIRERNEKRAEAKKS